jgi:hypothetical protein
MNQGEMATKANHELNRESGGSMQVEQVAEAAPKAELPAVLSRDEVLPSIKIESAKAWPSLKLGEIWAYRELVYFLVWRDIKVRYKQTVLGAGWALIQPLFTMLIFSVFFGRLAKVPSDGIPYPLFTFTALVPWMSGSGVEQPGKQREFDQEGVFSTTGDSPVESIIRTRRFWIGLRSFDGHDVVLRISPDDKNSVDCAAPSPGDDYVPRRLILVIRS